MKYIKPFSVTWLSSVTPLALGLFMAFEPVHHLTEWSLAVDTITGGVGAYVLINLGLAGIGIAGRTGKEVE